MMSTTRLAGLAAATIAASVAPGCDEGGRRDRDVTLQDLPREFAEVFCDAARDCLGGHMDLVFGSGDCELEVRAELEDATLPLWEDAVEGGTLEYHGSRFEDCREAVEGLGCDLLGNPDIGPCNDMLEGLVAAGGECLTDAECEGDGFCDFERGCPGRCTARVGEGAECDDDDHCDFGLTCQGFQCHHPADLGDPCGGAEGADCRAGLICLGEDGDQPGACSDPDDVMSGAEGEPCDPTAGSLCREGLSCVVDEVLPETTWHCVARSSSGGPCRYGFPDACPNGEYCDVEIGLGEVDGTCLALPGAGEACHLTLLGQPCEPGLACIEGSCLARQRLGASCTSPAQCYSGHCEGGICVAPSCP